MGVHQGVRQLLRGSAADSQVMRGLGPDQAVALLNVRGYSFDDVIDVKPLYVPKQALQGEGV